MPHYRDHQHVLFRDIYGHRELERERERETDRQTDSEIERMCACLCPYIYIYIYTYIRWAVLVFEGRLCNNG